VPTVRTKAPITREPGTLRDRRPAFGFALSLLVLLSVWRSEPLEPLEVSSAAGLIVAVLTVRVIADVENV